MNKRTIELCARLTKLGFTTDEALALRRIEMTLQHWGELCCGDSNDHCSTCIERDDETEKPFYVVRPHQSNNVQRYPVPDREKGALVRLAKIMAGHPRLTWYHQTDPRGCSLYILRKRDIPKGQDIRSCYTNGIAICD